MPCGACVRWPQGLALYVGKALMDSLLVPSSIQRIRAFLVEMCGMKVKPWVSTEEVLAALHATLTARQACDVFWSSLRVLLERLAGDLKARTEAEAGALIDNEILSAESYASLLDEIRTCLAKQTGGTGSAFRRLAQGLSAPALGLLLLLGGAVTVGCDKTSMSARTQDAALADAGQSDTVPGPPDLGPDSTTAQPDGRPDSQPDSDLHITLPDAPLGKSDIKEASSTAPEGGAVTIQDIMDSCNIPKDNQGMVLACLSKLQGSWSAALADYLAGKDCNIVVAALNCDTSLYSQCYRGSSSTPDFDPEQLPLCRPIPIYIGVSFV
jgi:hypothetical protein